MSGVSVKARMMAQTGKSALDFRADSVVGQIFRREGVPRSAEFERILGLPKRDWEDLPKGGYLEKLSQHLRKPESKALLRPHQVAMLTELFDYGGGIGNLQIGSGKTLLTALAPTLLAAQRPILLIPAKLREKTARDFQKLRQDWHVHPRIECISYEQLSRVKSAELLDSIKPDLLMADEVHFLANLNSGRTKRVRKFMRRHPETKFLGLSGTLTNRSLKQLWHLLMWGLRPQLMPLPRLWTELELWARAIDEKVEPESRIAPGVLLELAAHLPQKEPPEHPLMRARNGLRDRLRQTPGYVATQGTGIDVPITLELVKPPKSKAIDEALRQLRETWTTPNGVELTSPMEVWRYAATLACGFFYEWKPAAPKDWLQARKNWTRFLRQTLKHSRRYDTPEHLRLAVVNGSFSDTFEYVDELGKTKQVLPRSLLEAWQNIKDTYVYDVIPHWVDEAHLRWILEKYCRRNTDPMIYWVEHIAVGEKLSALSGMPYCQAGGKDQHGRFIEDLAGYSVIASVKSCGEGTNLQQGWHRNFVTSCEPVGKTWEQLIGRTHRTGQEADSVEVYVLNSCEEQESSFNQAVADCRFKFNLEGQQQRLLLADRV